MPGSSSSSSSEKQETVAVAHPPLVRNALRSMLIIGGAALALNTVLHAWLSDRANAPLWPILLGAAAFLFLWRLASLIFDLVFIWHRYIRHSGALKFLRHAILPARATQEPPASSNGK